MSLESKELYEFGEFRLDVVDHRLERIDGRASGSLQDKAFNTLVLFVRNQGRLISKNELFDAVWPDTIVEENNLDKAIHSIRQTLGEKKGEQKYIETIRRHGYRFVANVRRVEPENGTRTDNAGAGASVVSERQARSEEQTAADLTEREPSRDGVRSVADPVNRTDPVPYWRKPMLWGALGAAILLTVFGGWYLNARPGTAEGDNSPAQNDATSSRSNAYDLYVRGKVKVASENREDTEAAIKLLEEAIGIDPEYAEAYAHLARAYNTMAFKFTGDAERKQYQENAEVAIEKALAIRPNLAEAHFARGLILWNSAKRFPHEQAIRSYRRSLELDPRQDEAYNQLSMVYGHIGLMEDAERSINKALELNPNNTMARYRACTFLVWQGRSEEALAALKMVPTEVSPLLVERITAEALIQMGRWDQARSIVDTYLSSNPNDEGGSFTSLNSLLLAKSGRYGAAETEIQRAAAIGKGFGHFHHTAYNIASAYAVMNRPEEALKWLETAADDGFPNFNYFEIDPNLENLRTNQAFIELTSKLRSQWHRFKESV